MVAKISLILTESGPKNFYDVHAAVGPGALNRRDDVLLVQYFLRECFKTPRFSSNPFPGGVVQVDGKPGKQTFDAISHFQKVMKSTGANIATDGRVDPPINEQTRGSISGTQYTILTMNLGFAIARPQDWPRVSQATDCPPELMQLLREPVFVAP